MARFLESSDGLSVLFTPLALSRVACLFWLGVVVLLKNGPDGDGSCMDWEGDTSDDISVDDCSEDEVRNGPGHSFFLLMCFFLFFRFFCMPGRVGLARFARWKGAKCVLGAMGADGCHILIG